jgi:hypothetical protein
MSYGVAFRNRFPDCILIISRFNGAETRPVGGLYRRASAPSAPHLARQARLPPKAPTAKPAANAALRPWAAWVGAALATASAPTSAPVATTLPNVLFIAEPFLWCEFVV